MTLYTASKPLPYLAQCALWAAASLTRGHVLPGPRETWAPPVEEGVAEGLEQQWTRTIGRRPSCVAIYQRLDAQRQAITLMVCAGERSMLVRVRRDQESLERERLISAAAEAAHLQTFRVPRLVGSGEVEGWHWVGYELMARRPHRPRYRLADAAFSEITRLVETVVPRRPGIPAHWRGAHGDLTPWNLRRAQHSTWLIDWEDARWGPPGTDELYLRTVVAAIGHGTVVPLVIPPEQEEARSAWLRVLDDRDVSDSQLPLLRRMRLLLRSRREN